MIRHTNGEAILGVEYEMTFGGEVLDVIGPEQGGMQEALARVERNPGMGVVARIFHNLGEDEGYERVEVERRSIL